MRWREALSLCVVMGCTEAKPVSDASPPSQPARVAAAVDSVPLTSSRTPAPICSDTNETAALRCAQGAVARHGDTLLFRDAHGRHLVRVSNHVEGEQFLQFRYYGRMARPDGGHLHILDIHGYESGAVELIADDSGDSVTVPGYPIPSPDGLRFASSAASYETCEGTTVLEVWRLVGGAPLREFTVAPFDCTRDTGWWSTDETWRSPDTLSFIRHVLPTDRERHKAGASDTTNALLVRRASGCALDTASAASIPRAPSDSLDQ
jgi:hypothetical protein